MYDLIQRKNIAFIIIFFSIGSGAMAFVQFAGHYLGRYCGSVNWMFVGLINHLKPLLYFTSFLQIAFWIFALFVIYRFYLKNKDWIMRRRVLQKKLGVLLLTNKFESDVDNTVERQFMRIWLGMIVFIALGGGVGSFGKGLMTKVLERTECISKHSTGEALISNTNLSQSCN